MIPRQEISNLGKEGEPGLGNGAMMEGAGGVVVDFNATGTFLPGEHRPTPSLTAVCPVLVVSPL